MNKSVRWKQRFSSLEDAFLFLKGGVEKRLLDPYQEAGVIQSFEFTFELSWKTLKDYLESQGIVVSFPRDVIKEAFAAGLIKNGHIWIEMLEKRNILSRTYNRQQASASVTLIKEQYYPQLEQIYAELKKKCSA